jgi:uncharacterized protein (TIGR03435 family)
LKFHRETVDLPGFALVPGRNGSKLKPAESDELVTKFRLPTGQTVPKPSLDAPVALSARNWPISRLVDLLSAVGPGPVVDKSGLSGHYDFDLSWDENAGPALSTAIQQQLGLRLEAQKVPVANFVIDSAQKPGAN